MTAAELTELHRKHTKPRLTREQRTSLRMVGNVLVFVFAVAALAILAWITFILEAIADPG